MTRRTPAARRSIGPTGPSISQITYGTMRLRGTVEEAAEHLRALHEFGITTHHSSHEYDTHALYLEALAIARSNGCSFEHIVKLSSPSFDSNRFDPAEIRRLVHAELASLGTEQLASVQWLVRTPDAQDLATRLDVVRDQAEEIQECFAELVDAGHIANVSAFNYHPDFATALVDTIPDIGICDYLNLNEAQYAPLLDTVSAFFAIRPLAAGDLTGTPSEAAKALRWPLLHPTVTTVVLSVNSSEHVSVALEAAGTITPDLQKFREELPTGN